MDVNKEQLVNAIEDFKKAESKLAIANKDFNERMQKLKSCSGSSQSSGPAVIADAMVKLGELHLTEIRNDR